MVFFDVGCVSVFCVTHHPGRWINDEQLEEVLGRGSIDLGCPRLIVMRYADGANASYGVASAEIIHQHGIASNLINRDIENPASVGRDGNAGIS